MLAALILCSLRIEKKEAVYGCITFMVEGRINTTWLILHRLHIHVAYINIKNTNISRTILSIRGNACYVFGDQYFALHNTNYASTWLISINFNILFCHNIVHGNSFDKIRRVWKWWLQLFLASHNLNPLSSCVPSRPV